MDCCTGPQPSCGHCSSLWSAPLPVVLTCTVLLKPLLPNSQVCFTLTDADILVCGKVRITAVLSRALRPSPQAAHPATCAPTAADSVCTTLNVTGKLSQMQQHTPIILAHGNRTLSTGARLVYTESQLHRETQLEKKGGGERRKGKHHTKFMIK